MVDKNENLSPWLCSKCGNEDISISGKNQKRCNNPDCLYVEPITEADYIRIMDNWSLLIYCPLIKESCKGSECLFNKYGEIIFIDEDYDSDCLIAVIGNIMLNDIIPLIESMAKIIEKKMG